MVLIFYCLYLFNINIRIVVRCPMKKSNVWIFGMTVWYSSRVATALDWRRQNVRLWRPFKRLGILFENKIMKFLVNHSTFFQAFREKYNSSLDFPWLRDMTTVKPSQSVLPVTRLLLWRTEDRSVCPSVFVLNSAFVIDLCALCAVSRLPIKLSTSPPRLSVSVIMFSFVLR